MKGRTGAYKKTRKKVLEREGWHCIYCNAELNEFTASIDHIVKRADGGKSDSANLVASCLRCNNERDLLNLSAADYLFFKHNKGSLAPSQCFARCRRKASFAVVRSHE